MLRLFKKRNGFQANTKQGIVHEGKDITLLTSLVFQNKCPSSTSQSFKVFLTYLKNFGCIPLEWSPERFRDLQLI